MIYISSSNKIFKYDPELKNLDVIFKLNNSFFDLFTRKYKMFFGITYMQEEGKIIFACRDRLGTAKKNKASTDAIVYMYCPIRNQTEEYFKIKNIHDIHQITSYKEFILMTDTGQNRVVIYNKNKKSLKYLNIGNVREDINHINAILIKNDELYLGMNNNGKDFSEIVIYDLANILNLNLDSDDIMPTQNYILENIFHTHDLFDFNNDILFCDSHKGKIYRLSDQKNLYKINGWSRGLCLSGYSLFVGSSVRSHRSLRYTSKLDAQLYKIDISNRAISEEIKLPQCGQINDMISIEN